MDERDLLAARTFKHFQQAHKQQRFGNVTESSYLTAVLYILGAHCVDWVAIVWLQEQLRSADRYQNLPMSAKATLLMDKCGLSPNDNARALLTSPFFTSLSNMIAPMIPHGYDDKLYLFDSLFYQIGKSFSHVGQRHTEIIAALANGLNRGRPLFDLFPYSGEAFVAYELLSGPNDNHLTGAPLPEHHLVSLRLILRQIVPETAGGKFNPQEDTFGLIDSYFRDNPSPLDALRTCFHDRWVGHRALVILDSATQSKNRGLLAEMKDCLIDDDLLEAVIDFTSYKTDGSPLNLTAWVLNREKHAPNETICISIRPLLEDIKDVSTLQATWFATAVCELWASPNAFRLKPDLSNRMGPLKGLYHKLFDGGYDNVRGICEVISSDEALRGNVHAKKHVHHARFSSFSILDTRPLVNLILKREKSPLCLYIIGDNGAGKSQLLSAMIGSLNDWEISTFGIAFGASDRFPLSRQNKENSRFKYLGARTSAGFSANRVERELVKSLLDLFSDADKRNVFYRALEKLKFHHQLYLMPEGVADEVLRIPENTHRVIALSGLLGNKKKPRGRMELALLREDGQRIVRFKNLSSGEQQIIVLLAKAVSAAKRGAVLLVDEPEISLHTRWQQLLPKLFSDIARQISCAFVTATHSPTLIANATDSLSHCFLAKSQELTLLSRDQCHSVETILLDGFETYTPHNREIAERCAALVAKAIRAINQSQQPDFSVQEALLGELSALLEVMQESGDKQNPRFQQDVLLIERAQDAINETFVLAREEFQA